MDIPAFTAPAQPPPEPMAQLAPRLFCPACHGDLAWTPDAATCAQCGKSFTRQGAIWDFVVE
jgi:hypothetical protein